MNKPPPHCGILARPLAYVSPDGALVVIPRGTAIVLDAEAMAEVEQTRVEVTGQIPPELVEAALVMQGKL